MNSLMLLDIFNKTCMILGDNLLAIKIFTLLFSPVDHIVSIISCFVLSLYLILLNLD